MAALSTILAAGLAGKSLIDSDAQRRAANEESKRQKQIQEKAIAEKQEQEGLIDLNKTRDEAKRRQKQMTAGAGGRRDTILTSPMGVVPNVPGVGGKTLLGT